VNELDRRTVLAGAGALAAVALLPTSAIGADVVDPEVERLREWVGQLFDVLRAEGVAEVRLTTGGPLVFWLRDKDDLTSVQMADLNEEI
jgi:hypothetical protein